MILKTGRIKTKGFTLIEVLISMVILGFGLVIIMQSYLSSVKGLEVSQNYIEAMIFAKDKLNELELACYENNGLSAELGPDSGKGHFASRECSWISEAKAIAAPGYLAKKLVEVCVKLDWQEANIAKDAVLATYLPRAEGIIN